MSFTRGIVGEEGAGSDVAISEDGGEDSGATSTPACPFDTICGRCCSGVSGTNAGVTVRANEMLVDTEFCLLGSRFLASCFSRAMVGRTAQPDLVLHTTSKTME
jgi:hypothetical protein